MVIEKTLNNGVRMVMEPIPHVQSAAVGIWTRTGSIDETEREKGISHFIEHMLFKGTEKRSARQIAEDCDWIGAQVNAFTSKEATCYYMKVLSSELEKAGEILTDMFLHSQFDPEEMEREKQVIYEEMKMGEDDPEDDAQELLQMRIFRGTSFEPPVIGYRETLEPLKQNDLKEYLYEQYTADHVVVSVAGNFDPDTVCAYYEKALKGLKPSKADVPFQEAVYRPERFVKVKDVEQSHLCIGVPGVPIESELYYAYLVFSNIFGGSMSSRLFQKIREERGLAYSVYSVAHSYSKLGIFSIYAGIAHEKAEEAARAIAEELLQLRERPVEAREIHMAKLQLKSSFTFQQENVNSRMFSIGRAKLLRDRVKKPEEVLANIEGVTEGDLARVMASVSDLSQYSAVLVGRNQAELEGWLK